MPHCCHDGMAYIPRRKKSLARLKSAMFTAPALRGEAIMGALKIREAQFEPVERKSMHDPAQPDYNDEVTNDQLEAIQARVAQELDSDEWEIVDGPAW